MAKGTCVYCQDVVETIRYADSLSESGEVEYATIRRCTYCGADQPEPKRKSKAACLWPLGCNNGADVPGACFEHFVMTAEEWRAAASGCSRCGSRGCSACVA